MSTKKRPDVIGVASGKGGVGKTTIAVNLATAMAAEGRKVVLFDADMGLANAQIALGQKAPFHFGHVLTVEKMLEEVMVATPHGVKLIPGGSGISELANLDPVASGAVVQAFSQIQDDLDVLIVDAAAGISSQVITFMRAVGRRLIVVKDEPSSIADAYGMIKVLAQEGVTNDIYLLPNMMEDQAAGAMLHARINDVASRFLGLQLGYLGSIEHDELILAGLRKNKPVLAHAPGSLGARNFRDLATSLRNLPPPQGIDGGISFFLERQL